MELQVQTGTISRHPKGGKGGNGGNPQLAHVAVAPPISRTVATNNRFKITSVG